MKMMKTMAALALVAAAGTMPSMGQQGPDGTVRVYNSSKHAAWVTIYRGAGRRENVARGCAPGNGVGAHLNTKAASQSPFPYYVLVELKASTTGDCSVKSNIQVIEANQLLTGNTLEIKPTGPGGAQIMLVRH